MSVAVEQLELCVATFLDTKVPLWCPARAHLPKGTRASCTPEFRPTMPNFGAARETSLVEKRVASTYIDTVRYLVVFSTLWKAWKTALCQAAVRDMRSRTSVRHNSACSIRNFCTLGGAIVRKHPAAGQNTWIVGFFLGISTIVQSTVIPGNSWLWTV